MQGESNTPKYRVGMVAKLTGLSTHVLRVWERRYEAVRPQRTPKGGRLYSDADVRRLAQLSRLVRAGHSISAVAPLSDEALSAMEVGAPSEAALSPSTDATQSLRDQFLSAIEALDAERARRLIAGAALLLEKRELLTQVIAPILRAVGERWALGQFDVAQEHAATATLRSILENLVSTPAGVGRGHAVASTPSGERHELGAMMAGILVGLAGYRVTYLGPDLPAADMAAAVQRLNAKLLLLSVVCMPVEAAQAQLEEVVEHCSGLDVQILLGGAGAPELTHPRVRRLMSLESLIAYLQ
jgi:MerR family transcriptional regulator, light-induced transcriptional regulator